MQLKGRRNVSFSFRDKSLLLFCTFSGGSIVQSVLSLSLSTVVLFGQFLHDNSFDDTYIAAVLTLSLGECEFWDGANTDPGDGRNSFTARSLRSTNAADTLIRTSTTCSSVDHLRALTNSQLSSISCSSRVLLLSTVAEITRCRQNYAQTSSTARFPTTVEDIPPLLELQLTHLIDPS